MEVNGYHQLFGYQHSSKYEAKIFIFEWTITISHHWEESRDITHNCEKKRQNCEKVTINFFIFHSVIGQLKLREFLSHYFVCILQFCPFSQNCENFFLPITFLFFVAWQKPKIRSAWYQVFISHNFIFFSQNLEKRTQFFINFFNLLILLFRSKHGLPCYIEDEAYNLHTIWQLLCVVLLLMRRVTKGGRKYHVCEADVEEEAGGDGRNPLLDDGLSGDGQCDVQADEGGESAAHVQQQSLFHRQTAVQQDRKITWPNTKTTCQKCVCMIFH